MKRLNNIYPKIYDIKNIELADNKARKGKQNTYGVKIHDENRDLDNRILHLDLRNNDYHTSKYSTFKIHEPKERVIYRLPYYPDRITHHAIMNIMEPIWRKIFTRDTYSCIEGRGIHTLTKKLKQDLKKDREGTTYCLKMDIKKFYPSIKHDVLKSILRKKIKDDFLLKLLDEIIDSTDGVPIGNYLSQYFANLYLAYFDHWIKEELKVKYYYRYADDIVLLSDNKNKLRSWFLAMKIYLSNVLELKVKDNYQIFPVESRGIDFVGYVFRHNYTKLRKSIKQNLLKLVNKYSNKKISYEEFTKSMNSYKGWLKHCDSKNLLRKIENKVKIKYSGWNGKLDNISNFIGKTIYLINVETHNNYFKLQFLYKNKPYEIKSSNGFLFFFLMNYKNNLPITLKLK